MDLQNLAALVAIIKFGREVWACIWKKYQKPVRQFLSSCIEGILVFLTKIKRNLDNSDKNDKPSIYAVMRIAT